MQTLPVREILVRWGELFSTFNPVENETLLAATSRENPWFTPNNVDYAIRALGMMFQEEAIHQWLPVKNKITRHPKTVAHIPAGNIPMAGMHDIICTIAAGHRVQIKLSQSDSILIPHFIEILTREFPDLSYWIQLVDKLSDFDAVIATGSNNSAEHFRWYFRHVPSLIRHNKSSAAILTGNETEKDITDLGDDIFVYFGLGCRNVSKLYVNEAFDITMFYPPLEKFEEVIHHNKYANNYIYNKAIHLMNQVSIFDNNFLLLVENTQVYAPVSVIHYEKYSSDSHLYELLKRDTIYIQCCLMAKENLGLYNDAPIPLLSFGKSQFPTLTDYPDGFNTMHWLMSL